MYLSYYTLNKRTISTTFVNHRYMKWRLKNDVGLVVRCEYDALLPTTQGRSTYINIKALNEWDPKVRAGERGRGMEELLGMERRGRGGFVT